MERYEYKFVEVPMINGLKTTAGDTFRKCQEIICREANGGWRLKQVVTPFSEKCGLYGSLGYQIIFERRVNEA